MMPKANVVWCGLVSSLPHLRPLRGDGAGDAWRLPTTNTNLSRSEELASWRLPDRRQGWRRRDLGARSHRSSSQILTEGRCELLARFVEVGYDLAGETPSWLTVSLANLFRFVARVRVSFWKVGDASYFGNRTIAPGLLAALAESSAGRAG